MRVVGIVAEYNPLHNGHIYHMEQAKRLTGAAYCVVVMSGNFVQRGEPACTDKFTRAQWALEAGADLVIELPSVFAVASAERFASGAVRLLHQTGIVTDLAFGCEQSSLPVLEELAALITREPPEYRQCLRYHLQEGKSYPRARYEALADIGVGQQSLQELSQPNNILAMEYLRSLKRLGSPIRPVPVERIGGGYNEARLTGEYSSAGAIRDAVRAGDKNALNALPLFVSGAMQFDSQFPLTVNDVSSMMLYKLRMLGPEGIRLLPDVSEGFEQAMYAAARTSVDGDGFFEAVKSRRYTMARCKRIGMSALLDMSADLCADMEQDGNLYYKILGMRRDARALLSAISSVSPVPVIMRNSDMLRCTDAARESMRVDALSTDILGYALQKPLHRDSESAVLV